MNTVPNTGPQALSLSDAAFAQISALARAEAGLILPASKITMVQSRLRSRLTALNITSYEAYAKFVAGAEGDVERRMMISALTTNVSHFFRENHHFEILRRDAFPELLQQARKGEGIRIWSAGCSSGQEPYSIAMLIHEYAPELVGQDTLILASDIDPKIMEAAEAGTYSEQQIAGIPLEMQKKYLKKSGSQYCVSDNLKKMIRFRELNLIGNWPMRMKFDVIFCRNVVIYFDNETQNALWPRFRNALKPSGWFFLGHSERVADTSANDFQSVGMTAYRPIQNRNPLQSTLTNAREA